MMLGNVLTAWNLAKYCTQSSHPILTILSGGFQYTFQRGDVLLLWNTSVPLELGSLVAFHVRTPRGDTFNTPTVHRLVQIMPDKESGGNLFLTKGDDNRVNDRDLCGSGWLKRRDVVGTVVGVLPHVGSVVILLNDCPMLWHLLMSWGLVKGVGGAGWWTAFLPFFCNA